MATATITQTVSKKKGADAVPESERFLRCCSDVANALIEDHEATKNGKASRDINLNALRSKLAKKHKLANIPALTAIIAAIPEHYKKYILPKLIAKPIRTSFVHDAPIRISLTNMILKVLRLVLLWWLSCVNLTDARTLPTPETFASTALVAPTPISNTAHNPTLATNQLQCELSERDTTHLSRLVAAWTS